MGYSIRIFSMHYQGNRFFPWFWINKKSQELNGPAAFHPKIINMKWGLKAWNAQPFLLVMHPMNDMQSCLNGCINITFTKFLASLFKLMKAQVFLFETMLSNQLPNGGLSFPCLVIGKRRIKQSPSNLAMRESNWDRSMTTKKKWDEACTVSSTCLHGELLAFTLELEACINIYIYKSRFFGPKKHTPRPWVHWHITRPGRVVPGSFCVFFPASCSQLSHQSPWPPFGGHSIGGSWSWGSPHSGPERLGRFFFTYRFTPEIWESNVEHLWSIYIYIIYLLRLPFLFFWEIWVQHTHKKNEKNGSC